MGKALLQIDRRRSSGIILGVVVVLGYAMMASVTGAVIDRGLMPLRFEAIDRAASGKVVVVEMDAESAAQIKRWPWSRDNYARVVDRLRQAGAASIVFDVDFSSPSDDVGDRSFAAALARADGLVTLPTFGQIAGSKDRRIIDALPIPLLRTNVALASVSIRPDPDGQVRSMPFGTVTAGIPRPSLSAYISAQSGAADADFPIDMSIDPRSIPKLSFVDVRDGRFDPKIVTGRNMLIGATAVEMGDRYGTPQWGVIPGVIVQALAAETLLRGVPVRGSPLLMLLLASIAVAGLVRFRSSVPSIGVGIMSATSLVVCVLVAQHHFLLIYPVAIPLTMIATATLACIFRDVLGRFRNQRRTDEATGLPNARALFQPHNSNAATILAAAQIDNYEALRAVLGNRIAADVIIRVGERLALIGEHRSVFRTADHQLAFFLPAERPIDDTLHGLRAILLQPVEVGGRRVDVAVSIGVASGNYTGIERLLSDATLAADEARVSGAFWYRAATDIDELERSISLMGELDEAMADDQIEVFYQPKYHLRTHRIVSVEALVRWRHPTRGFIGPDVFIPIAEKTNRIASLTIHVIKQVVHDVTEWRRHHPGITAAVNISAKLLSAPEFNADVERVLANTETPNSAFVFEVTESAAMSNTTEAITALHRYRELGVAISMDDYGTGQSTLTYLRQLPLSELKIDRSFVQFAHQNRDDGILVRSTIELAHELGLKVVAEGVEDAECLKFLEATGCDLVQGYLISRPLPLAQFKELLAKEYYYAA